MAKRLGVTSEFPRARSVFHFSRQSLPILVSALTALSLFPSPSVVSAQPRNKKPFYQKALENPPVTDLEGISGVVMRPALNFQSSVATEQLTGAHRLNNKEIRRYDQVYPVPNLEKVGLSLTSRGEALLDQLPKFESRYAGKLAARSRTGELVFFTLNPELQDYVSEVVKSVAAPHVAVVAVDPTSGKVLALAEKSTSLSHAVTHSQFPAASLIKVITSAAALENSQLTPKSVVRFRGGTYTLNSSNYLPSRFDNRQMTLTEGLGASCNPLFARVAINHLQANVLQQYTRAFGFQEDLGFEAPLRESTALIPSNKYGYARAAAGFGEVHISPLHAALIAATVSNGGVVPKPYMIERVTNQKGTRLHQGVPRSLKRALKADTASKLLSMMTASNITGTSRRAFQSSQLRKLAGQVASKTGTLRGTNPVGLNKWFIAAAPISKPKIALSVIVVNPKNANAGASLVGRKVVEKALQVL